MVETVIHLSSERSWRGGEQQIAYLIEELKKKGVNNIVLCRKGSAFSNYCKKHKISFYELPFKSEFDFYTAWKIKSIAKAVRADIIHIHTGHSHGLAIWSHLLGNKVPLLLSRRVDFKPKTNPLSTFKYKHPSIRKVICVSGAIRKIMADYLEDDTKCITIHSGIDLNRFRRKKTGYLNDQFDIPENKFVIGNVSALADHKDYFTFVDTAKILLEKSTRFLFIVAGTGPMEEEIKKYSFEKLGDNILFIGYRDDIPDILPELDLFLMTSKTEGLGTSLLDAQASGVPIVSTKAGGIPEIIQHNKNGLLSEVKNPQKLAEQVIYLFENKEKRKKLLTQGLADVQRFRKKATTEKTLNVYNDIKKGLT